MAGSKCYTTHSIMFLASFIKAQARVITTQEEETLWTTDVVGTTSPKSLLNEVFFTMGCICAFVVEMNIEISSISQFEFGLIDNPENMSEKN